jgi:hypothetical protein
MNIFFGMFLFSISWIKLLVKLAKFPTRTIGSMPQLLKHNHSLEQIDMDMSTTSKNKS